MAWAVLAQVAQDFLRGLLLLLLPGGLLMLLDKIHMSEMQMGIACRDFLAYRWWAVRWLRSGDHTVQCNLV